MDQVVTYRSGSPVRRINVDAVLDSIADQVLTDGDVEKALQRTFRFGTEDDMGLLDILDRLRTEADDIQHDLQESDQHANDLDEPRSKEKVEDAIAMRDALRQVESLEDLQGLDPEMMQRTLTSDEMEWVEKWADMTGQLIDSGLVAMSGPRLVLTAKAIRQIGSRLLRHMFLPPTRRGRGSHQINLPGLHGSIQDETSRWEWGKPFDLHVSRTITNSIRLGRGGSSVAISPDDFEVFDRESAAAVATVLLTDMSRSMFESGAWDAAKRAAVALNTLITTSRTHDHLELVGFSGDARKLGLEELPALSWDEFSHGTNLHAGLQIAARLLNGYRGMNQQVVIITDGEPTAYMDGADPVFEHPVTERTIDATLLAARRLAKQGVAFTTICVGDAGEASEFAHMLSQVTNGRMILLPLDELGAFVVRDVASGAEKVVR